MKKEKFKSSISLKFNELKSNSTKKSKNYKLNFSEWPAEVNFQILNGFKKSKKFKKNINQICKKSTSNTLMS
jgi:hypothetical protein